MLRVLGLPELISFWVCTQQLGDWLEGFGRSQGWE